MCVAITNIMNHPSQFGSELLHTKSTLQNTSNSFSILNYSSGVLSLTGLSDKYLSPKNITNKLTPRDKYQMFSQKKEIIPTNVAMCTQ